MSERNLPLLLTRFTSLMMMIMLKWNEREVGGNGTCHEDHDEETSRKNFGFRDAEDHAAGSSTWTSSSFPSSCGKKGTNLQTEINRLKRQMRGKKNHKSEGRRWREERRMRWWKTFWMKIDFQPSNSILKIRTSLSLPSSDSFFLESFQQKE